MEKVIFALRLPDERATDEWCAGLRTGVADRVRAAGAAGLTVHVRDAPVRPALLRLTTLDPPIAAVVAVWVEQSYDARTAAIAELLAADGVRAHGYLVTESVPLRLPAGPPAARTDGFANIAFLRRPADLDAETWRARWQQAHTEVALRTQATVGYTQNLVVRAVTPDAPPVAAIVEEQFPLAALTDPMAWYRAEDQADLAARLRAMVDSVATFGADRNLDTVPTSRYEIAGPFA